jgi:hypothetical protein
MDTSPNFERLRELSTIEVWEGAATMRGIDPEALGEVTDAAGFGIDLSHEIRSITSAITIGDLVAFPATSAKPTSKTTVRRADFIAWLRTRGRKDLADSLSDVAPGAGTDVRWTPGRIRELMAFRGSHSAAETAQAFGVSQARIRAVLAKAASAQASASDPFGRAKKRKRK